MSRKLSEIIGVPRVFRRRLPKVTQLYPTSSCTRANLEELCFHWDAAHGIRLLSHRVARVIVMVESLVRAFENHFYREWNGLLRYGFHPWLNNFAPSCGCALRINSGVPLDFEMETFVELWMSLLARRKVLVLEKCAEWAILSRVLGFHAWSRLDHSVVLCEYFRKRVYCVGLRKG